MCSTPERAVGVRALLCFWARHSTLTVALFTHGRVEISTGELNVGGNPAMDYYPIQGGGGGGGNTHSR